MKEVSVAGRLPPDGCVYPLIWNILTIINQLKWIAWFQVSLPEKPESVSCKVKRRGGERREERRKLMHALVHSLCTPTHNPYRLENINTHRHTVYDMYTWIQTHTSCTFKKRHTCTFWQRITCAHTVHLICWQYRIKTIPETKPAFTHSCKF